MKIFNRKKCTKPCERVNVRGQNFFVLGFESGEAVLASDLESFQCQASLLMLLLSGPTLNVGNKITKS